MSRPSITSDARLESDATKALADEISKVWEGVVKRYARPVAGATFGGLAGYGSIDHLSHGPFDKKPSPGGLMYSTTP